MKIDISKIVNQVDLKRAIEFYTGGRFNRSGFINCPFHTDKTPSLSVKGDRFHCFSCDRGGDVIDFTRAFFNLDFRAACKKLNDDFNLGLSFDGREETKRKESNLWDRAIVNHAEQRKQAIKEQIDQTEKDRERIEQQIKEMVQKKPVDWGTVNRLEEAAECRENTIRFLRAL